MSFSPQREAKRIIRQPRKPYVAPVASRLELRHRSGKLLLARETFNFSDIVQQALTESIDLRGSVLLPHVDNHKQLEHVTSALVDLDFRGHDLTRVNFRRNAVIRCNFAGCNLYASILDGYFEECNFTGASIRRATIYEAPPDIGTFATSGNRKLFVDCILSDVRFDVKTYQALKILGYCAQSIEDF